MDHGLESHVLLGAAIVYALERLKASPRFRWLTIDSARANRIASAVLAAGVAWGFTLTGDASIGWTLHIPPPEVLGAGVIEWGKQFLAQQLIYDVLPKSGAPLPAGGQ